MTLLVFSMINLMEGIIPEYDRKGKVCLSYSPHITHTIQARCVH